MEPDESDDFVSLAIIWMGKSVFILLMEEILHQLIWRVSHDLYARFYLVLYIPDGAGILPKTVVDEHRK